MFRTKLGKLFLILTFVITIALVLAFFGQALNKIAAVWFLTVTLVFISILHFKKELQAFSVSKSGNDNAKTDFFPELDPLLERLDEVTRLYMEQNRIFDLATPSMFIRNMEGHIKVWNQEAQKLYGFSTTEARGQIAHELLASLFAVPIEKIEQELLATGKWVGEIVQSTKSGRQITVRSHWILSCDSRGKPVMILEINQDLTEEKRIKDKLPRFEQLSLISQMAAGVSHEIRNPMTTVRGYLQHLSRIETLRDYNPKFELMIDELDRANQIISEFLSLAKEKKVNLSPQDINNVVYSITPLIEADAASCGKSFKILLNPEIPLVMLDSSEIRQLILNLVRNGLEAGTSVRVKTYIEKNHVVLAVEDDGLGIPLEVMHNFGKPFNTTKENGTGLGISICYTIATRHAAMIDVSTGRSGTVFYVKFPVCSCIPETTVSELKLDL